LLRSQRRKTPRSFHRDGNRPDESPEVNREGPQGSFDLYFINRSGEELSPRRKKELEKAKHLMQARAAAFEE
jgi:hypothetical protein